MKTIQVVILKTRTAVEFRVYDSTGNLEMTNCKQITCANDDEIQQALITLRNFAFQAMAGFINDGIKCTINPFTNP